LITKFAILEEIMLKKPKSLISMISLLCMLFLCLFSCNTAKEPLPVSKPEITLRIASLEGELNMYRSSGGRREGGKAFDITKRELLPFWKVISELVGVKLTECEVSDFDSLGECDLIIGGVYELDLLAREGALVDLSTYLSTIPSVKERLYDKDLIFSYMGETKYNEFGIYVIPSVSGEAEFSFLPFFNAEAVRLLLDSEDVSFSKHVADEIFLTPYMPEDGSLTVDIIGADGECSKLTKNYNASGNIVSLLRLYNGKELTGERAVKAFRNYIDKAYGGYYGDRRSDLFLGESAAYDADELAALLICAGANFELLGERGLPSVLRAETEQKALSVLAALYGVRGHNGGYTYVSHSGELRDSRTEPEIYELLDMLNKWIRSGIIEIGEEKGEGAIVRFGADIGEDAEVLALPPIAKWYDGSNLSGRTDEGVYMRFTESVSYAEELAVGISKSGVANSSARLDAALKLIETVSSDEGREAIGSAISLGDPSALRLEADLLGYSCATDLLSEKYGVCQGIFPINDRALNRECDDEIIDRALECGILKTTSTEWERKNNWYRTSPTLLPYTREEYSRLSEVIKHNCENSGESFSELSLRIAQNGLLGAGFEDKYALLAYINSIWKISEYNKLITDGYYTVGVYYYEYANGIEY
jgi:hypothetical protein